MAGLETASAVNGNRILMGICLSYGVVSFCDTCRYHVFVLVALHSFSACGKMALNTLGATAFLMLLFKPIWLFDVGFNCLFGCCGNLASATRTVRIGVGQEYGSTENMGLATVSVAAQVGTAPLVMFYFSRFSTHFLLTNLWVIPLVSLIVYAAVVLLVLTPFPACNKSLRIWWKDWFGCRICRSVGLSNSLGLLLIMFGLICGTSFCFIFACCWSAAFGQGVRR